MQQRQPTQCWSEDVESDLPEPQDTTRFPGKTTSGPQCSALSNSSSSSRGTLGPRITSVPPAAGLPRVAAPAPVLGPAVPRALPRAPGPRSGGALPPAAGAARVPPGLTGTSSTLYAASSRLDRQYISVATLPMGNCDVHVPSYATTGETVISSGYGVKRQACLPVDRTM